MPFFITTHATCKFHEWIIAWRNIIKPSLSQKWTLNKNSTYKFLMIVMGPTTKFPSHFYLLNYESIQLNTRIINPIIMKLIKIISFNANTPFYTDKKRCHLAKISTMGYPCR